MFKKFFMLSALFGLSACTSMLFQPIGTITQITPDKGYRIKNVMNQPDGNLIIVMFSGGGSRAAALGYGVLEQFKQTRIKEFNPTLLESIDLVFGVSGGSVLATYFALEGQEVVPKFEENFLKKDFESQLTSQFFSLANLPKLGRVDLSSIKNKRHRSLV